MFEAMLRGWRAQQTARGLREDTIVPRERLVRRFGEFTNEYPWAWSAGHMDEWSLHLRSERHLAPSTIRAYQGSLRQFSEFLVDARYGWAVACERESVRVSQPVQVCHEWNTAAHLADYEGGPERRPLTRGELQAFLDEPMTRWRALCGRAEGRAGGLPGRDGVQGRVRVGAVLQGPPGALEANFPRLRSSEAVR